MAFSPLPSDARRTVEPVDREYDVAAAMRRALAEVAGEPAALASDAPLQPEPVVPSWKGRLARRFVGPYSKIVQTRFLGYAARWVVALIALPRQRATLREQGREIAHLSRMMRALQGEVQVLREELAAARSVQADARQDLETYRGHFETYRDRNAIADNVYLAFEDWFRGPRELIRQRLGLYVDLLRERGVPTDLPVLDIGCGRGEWLRLLDENGIHARGVDTNAEMVEQCRAQGFAVQQTDALTALAALPSGSLAALTGFHIIEHIPLQALQTLLAEAYRVLAPGGLLILETPNPENLVVGGCNFYIDPTHARPLHPLTVQFLARVFLFPDPEILRLKQHRLETVLDALPADDALASTVNPLVEQVQAHLLSAPDYALVAQKPAVTEGRA